MTRSEAVRRQIHYRRSRTRHRIRVPIIVTSGQWAATPEQEIERADRLSRMWQIMEAVNGQET